MRFACIASTLLLAVSACQPPATKIPDSPLRETRWMLRQIGATQVRSGYVAGREPYLLVRTNDDTEGQGGCNSFGGKAVIADNQVAFPVLRSTRMACDALSTENAFMQALDATHYYRINGNLLLLYPDAQHSSSPLAQLEAAAVR